jgi:hypothetical protein
MWKEAVVTFFEKRVTREYVKVADISRYLPNTRKIFQITSRERYRYASLTGRRIDLHTDMVCVHLTVNPLTDLPILLWQMDCSVSHDWKAHTVLSILIVEVSRSHSDAPHSVGLLWTSDQPVAETPTLQNATIANDRQNPGGIRTRSPNK